MTLDASTYFGHLRAYVNDRYVMHDGTGGEVVLREKFFPATGTRAKTREIHLLLPGPGDADGEVLAIEDLMLPPNWHGAQNMPPLFDLSSFTGSLEVTSTEPIVSLSLNFEAAPVFSSLPPGELDAAAQGSTTYYFPHLAVGASWQTTITYINYSREEVTCQTDLQNTSVQEI